MYVIHATNSKFEEYEDKELTLEKALKKKIGKLIVQIKTQKIIHPEIHISKKIRKLSEFKSGEHADYVEGLLYEIYADDKGFYIEKQFTDARYVTMRYFSVEKDDNYLKYRSSMIQKAGNA